MSWPPSRPLQPPRDEAELLHRAEALTGRTLGELAAWLGRAPPAQPARAKGWTGQLIEAALGAPASNEAGPDFAALGVELKTLPVDHQGAPRASTFVCQAPLDLRLSASWAQSRPKAKLSRVLWVPVVGEAPLPERRVGATALWRPEPDEEDVLRADYEEIAELVHAGQASRISARVGRALQLRPKAADNQRETWVVDAAGDWMTAQPRGFYLRRSFTHALLARRFLLT